MMVRGKSLQLLYVCARVPGVMEALSKELTDADAYKKNVALGLLYKVLCHNILLH